MRRWRCSALRAPRADPYRGGVSSADDRVSSDSGEADPRLLAALAAGDEAQVLAALVDARVFAAITATATGVEQGAHGLTQESSAEMAVVLLAAEDGSRALPVFPDLASLRRWRLDARPVRLTGPQACAAAQDERATAVVLDPGGAAFVVTDLAAVAAGFVPVPGSTVAARRGTAELRAPTRPVSEALVHALQGALAEEGLRSARLLEGPDGPVLGVCARVPLGPAALAALAHRLVPRLGAALPADGLDLAEVPLDGPGLELLRHAGKAPDRRWRRRR